MGRLHAFVEKVLVDRAASSQSEIQVYLKHALAYTGAVDILPLGVRGGLPSKAAVVDLDQLL